MKLLSLTFTLMLTQVAQASHGQYGCFPIIENAAGDLRRSVTVLAQTAQRYEPQGQTQIASEAAARQVGAYQYLLSRTCDEREVLRGRDQVRDALDRVRQAFRASPILPNRPDAFQAFRTLVEDWERLRDLVSDLNSSNPGLEGFFQVDGQECNQFCASIGMMSGISREGSQCASGEVRPESAFGKINFTYGCWKDCTPRNPVDGRSVGNFCYKSGQKHDNDRTDITVGCFCRR